MGSVCRCLYDAKVIKDHRFVKDMFCEDLIFSLGIVKDEHKLNIVHQKKMIHIFRYSHHGTAIVRRANLVSRHSAEERVCPARLLTCSFMVFGYLLPCSDACPGIVLIKDSTLNIGRKEIHQRYQHKCHNGNYVWQK